MVSPFFILAHCPGLEMKLLWINQFGCEHLFIFRNQDEDGRWLDISDRLILPTRTDQEAFHLETFVLFRCRIVNLISERAVEKEQRPKIGTDGADVSLNNS